MRAGGTAQNVSPPQQKGPLQLRPPGALLLRAGLLEQFREAIAMCVVVNQDGPKLRSLTPIRMGLGGLAAWDGVRWVNVLDGQPWNGQGSMSHGTTRSM